MRYYFSQAVSGIEVKAPLSIVLAAIAVAEGFYTSLIWGFLALFAIDLLTGVLKSYKNGVPITSKRLRESVIKLGGYMFLITALIIASKYEATFAPVVKGVYIYFMLTEFKSIIENVEEMGVKVPQIVKSLINLRLKFHGGEDKAEDKKPDSRRKGGK